MAFGEEEIISLPFRYLVYTVAGLPLGALFLCVVCALVFHFEAATSTHCNVQNWLPSVSAAVSTFAPEKYIWRTLIGLHSAPRFVLAVAYRNFLLSSPLMSYRSQLFRYLCQLGCALHFVENLSLLLLTSISSTENHDLHKLAFGIFVASSLVYMCLSTYLFNYSGRRRAVSRISEMSFEYKTLTSSVSIIAVCAAGYLYYRHNVFCEPGIYTLFALSEYTVILSNVAFHSTLFWDFHDKSLILGTSMGGGYHLLPIHNIEHKNT